MAKAREFKRKADGGHVTAMQYVEGCENEILRFVDGNAIMERYFVHGRMFPDEEEPPNARTYQIKKREIGGAARTRVEINAAGKLRLVCSEDIRNNWWVVKEFFQDDWRYYVMNNYHFKCDYEPIYETWDELEAANG